MASQILLVLVLGKPRISANKDPTSAWVKSPPPPAKNEHVAPGPLWAAFCSKNYSPPLSDFVPASGATRGGRTSFATCEFQRGCASLVFWKGCEREPAYNWHLLGRANEFAF